MADYSDPMGAPPDPRCPPPEAQGRGGSSMFGAGSAGMASGLSAGLRPSTITASEILARRSAMAQQQRDTMADALIYGVGMSNIALEDTLKVLKPKAFKDELQDEIDKWLDDIP